jgi:queuine/archaeosine tRNA-ribosyltransferase
MTGVRLLAIHNLAYLERLVRGARETIQAGGFAGYRERILGGAAPWAALRSAS